MYKMWLGTLGRYNDTTKLLVLLHERHLNPKTKNNSFKFQLVFLFVVISDAFAIADKWLLTCLKVSQLIFCIKKRIVAQCEWSPLTNYLRDVINHFLRLQTWLVTSHKHSPNVFCLKNPHNPMRTISPNELCLVRRISTHRPPRCAMSILTS